MKTCIKCRNEVKGFQNICRLCSTINPTCKTCGGHLKVPSWILCEGCDGTSKVNKHKQKEDCEKSHPPETYGIKNPIVTILMEWSDITRLFYFECEENKARQSNVLVYDGDLVIGYK